MRVVDGTNAANTLREYILEKIQIDIDPSMAQYFVVLNDKNVFCAVVTVSNYTETNCEISCISETSLAWSRSVCEYIFNYVFVKLGCVRCTSLTTKSNRRARGFLDALNFKLEGRLRRGYDGERDALVYGLLREECQFLADFKGFVDGQENTEGTSRARSGSDCTSSINAE